MSSSPLFGQPLFGEPLFGQARQVEEDMTVTLTPIPDLSEVVGRGARRRALVQLQELMTRGARPYDAARPASLDAPALTVPAGSVRATLTLEDGPAGHHGDGSPAGTAHWHLAMSLSRDGQRGPAPAHELAAWIAVAWPHLAAVDTFVMTGLPTARHVLVPRTTTSTAAADTTNGGGRRIA